MKANRKVLVLCVVALAELLAIVILCFRCSFFKMEYERISRRFSDLYLENTEMVGKVESLVCGQNNQKCILLHRYRNERIPVRICPHCGGDAVRLEYGLVEVNDVDSANYDLSGRMRYIYAGCDVREAEWRCVSCAREFKLKRGVMSEVMMNDSGQGSRILGNVDEGQYLRASFTKIESVGIESVSFHDITGDGIPEIWLLTGGSEADRTVRVYSISDWNKELFWETAGIPCSMQEKVMSSGNAPIWEMRTGIGSIGPGRN